MSALEVLDLHAGYGRREVLTGISLAIEPGEWLCLLGPNGVGKTTLLHCLAGRVRPQRGRISIGGASLFDRPSEAKQGLGYACAPEQLPALLTGRHCLEVYALAKGLTPLDLEVKALADALRFTPYLDACVDTYSLGTRQKLCVLLALLGQPRLIVLDEAFNGLDPRSSLILKRELQRRLQDGAAVLLATHSLDVVEHYADVAALMIDGRIVQQWDRPRLAAPGFDLESALAAAYELSSDQVITKGEVIG